MAHDKHSDTTYDHIENSDDVEKLRKVLRDKEKVLYVVACINDGSDGVIAATNQRVLFCDQKLIMSDIIEFLYSEIAVVLSEDQLLTTKVSLIGIDKALYVEGIDKASGKDLLDYLGQHIGQDFESHGSTGRHLKHVGELLNVDDMSDSVSPADTDHS